MSAPAYYAQSTTGALGNNVNTYKKTHVAEDHVVYARLKKSGDDLEKLDAQLDEQTRLSLNNPTFMGSVTVRRKQ